MSQITTDSAKRGPVRRGLSVVASGLLSLCFQWIVAGQAASAGPYSVVTPLPQFLVMHGTVVMGDFLYVVGGIEGPGAGTGLPTRNVLRSRISNDGNLAPWVFDTPLPANRHYIASSTFGLNGVLYVVGGKDGATTRYYNNAVWSRPDANGVLSPWRETPAFAPEDAGLSFSTVVATPGHLHLIGGLVNATSPTAAVITAPIEADGSIASWQAGPALPEPLWWHNAVALGGRVYVWGGLPTAEYTTISPRVYSAPITGSGELAAWRREPSELPQPFFGATSATAGSYLLAFCPRYGLDKESSQIWYSQLGADGLSAWAVLNETLPNRIYQASASDYTRGYVYLVGGRPSRASSTNNGAVLAFKLSGETHEAPRRMTIPLPEVPAAVVQQQREASLRVALAAPAPADGPAPSAILAPWQKRDTAATVSAAATTVPAARTAAVIPIPPAEAPSMTLASGQQGEDNILPSGAIPGFVSYGQARALTTGPTAKPLVIYFDQAGSEACEAQRASLRQDVARLQRLSGKAAFAWVDVDQAPQLAQFMGVFRAPAWCLFDTQGQPLAQHQGALGLDRIEAALGTMRP